MELSTLNTGLKIFLSREVTGSAGEDLVEKQNAEPGLMPVLEDEAGIYGYTLENRHMVECFRSGRQPMATFQDGVGVIEMLMALCRSAELERTVQLPDPALEAYIPRWRAVSIAGNRSLGWLGAQIGRADGEAVPIWRLLFS